MPVAPPSIRLWILKLYTEGTSDVYETVRCTPFDPLVDTETERSKKMEEAVVKVAPPSIRLWILKRIRCYIKTIYVRWLHPLRSACGY